MCGVNIWEDSVPPSSVAIPPPPAARGWGSPANFVETLEEIKASVSIEEYLKGSLEVSELLFANEGLGNLSIEQMKSLSPIGLNILTVQLMGVVNEIWK